MDDDEGLPTLHRGLPKVLHVFGGLPEPVHATAGGHWWQRLPDETTEQFCDRVGMAATASREPMLVILGLPR